MSYSEHIKRMSATVEAAHKAYDQAISLYDADQSPANGIALDNAMRAYHDAACALAGQVADDIRHEGESQS